MKKLFAILTLLAVLLSAVAFAETAELTGDWYLVELVMGETSINPSAMGMAMTLTLNEDGTASILNTNDNDGDSAAIEGTWEPAENGILLTTEEEPDNLVLEEGLLKMDVNGEGFFIFGRELPEAFVMPAAVAAESEEAFQGTWILSGIGFGDAILPTDGLGEGNDSILTIEDGKATLVSGEESDEYACTFADGALTLTSDVEGEDPMPLALNDDGSISITLTIDGEPFMSMYFEKAE